MNKNSYFIILSDLAVTIDYLKEPTGGSKGGQMYFES